MTEPKPITEEQMGEIEALLAVLDHLTIADSFSGRAGVEEEKALSYFREHLPRLIRDLREAREALGELMLNVPELQQPGYRQTGWVRRAARILQKSQEVKGQ